LATIRAMFARRKRTMPDRNSAQAMFPQGSTVVSNPHGTAPGIDLTVACENGTACRVFALPGVPAEMREMWQATLEPAISDMTGGGRVIRHRRLKCFGIGESDLEQLLPDLIRRGRDPSVGITVSQATITLRVTAAGASAEECAQIMAPTLETIHECLGDLVFGEEDDELQDTVIRLLQEQGKTLAVAESGSGGLLAHWLSEADEDARSFRGGVVQRGEPRDEVTAELIAQSGLQSNEVVMAMAQEARRRFLADYGLAISAFPNSDADGGIPGRVAFAIDCEDGGDTHSTPFAGHPEILKPRAAKQALDFLRKMLRNAQ